jgi:transcriptional regulator NrdR family protein
VSKALPGGIACDLCGARTKVVATRKNRDGIRRDRKCRIAGCIGRLTTVEVIVPEGEAPWMIHQVVTLLKKAVA